MQLFFLLFGEKHLHIEKEINALIFFDRKDLNFPCDEWNVGLLSLIKRNLHESQILSLLHVNWMQHNLVPKTQMETYRCVSYHDRKQIMISFQPWELWVTSSTAHWLITKKITLIGTFDVLQRKHRPYWSLISKFFCQNSVSFHHFGSYLSTVSDLNFECLCLASLWKDSFLLKSFFLNSSCEIVVM